MMTGMHSATPERLQLGAGVFLKNLDLTGVSSAVALRQRVAAAIAADSGVLGATRGGGTFRAVPQLRSIEADGAGTPFVGGTVLDGWDVRMTGTLLEITPANFADALVCAEVITSGGMTTLRAWESLEDEDYIPQLCWIGDTARGLMLIELTGVLNVKGAAFTFRDRGEGELPFEFRAHADSAEQETAPFRVVFLG